MICPNDWWCEETRIEAKQRLWCRCQASVGLRKYEKGKHETFRDSDGYGSDFFKSYRVYIDFSIVTGCAASCFCECLPKGAQSRLVALRRPTLFQPMLHDGLIRPIVCTEIVLRPIRAASAPEVQPSSQAKEQYAAFHPSHSCSLTNSVPRSAPSTFSLAHTKSAEYEKPLNSSCIAGESTRNRLARIKEVSA